MQRRTAPGGAANPNGILDEVSIYGGLELGGYDTNTPLADGGLTSDANEYLGDGAKNLSMVLSPVSGVRAGSYFYFGTDSKFRGLNVALQTPGAWTTTPGNLAWEYWNGTAWGNLEVTAGFADSTDQLTRNGTVSWTADPPGGRPTR